MQKRKNNITFFAPRYHTNQTDIVRLLKEAGYDVSFLVLKKDELENYESLEPIILEKGFMFRLFSAIFKQIDNPKFKRRFQTISILQLYRHIKSNKTDYIIIRNPDTVPGMLVAITSFVLNPEIIFYHQLPYYGVSNKKSVIINLLNVLLRSKSYTPVLGDDKNEVSIKTKNYHIPFPIPDVSYDSYNNDIKSNSRFEILTIGKYQKQKNLYLLIDAIDNMNNSDINLTIIGRSVKKDEKTYYSELKEYILSKSKMDNIKLIRNVDHNKIGKFYRESDLFVLPSQSDVFPFSILEAMGASLPVICSDVCGSKYYIKEGENGYVFKSKDKEDLINCIIKVYNDDFKGMGLKSKELSNSLYSSDKFISGFENLLK